MKVSYRWLQEFVDIPWPPHELADRLTAAGVTVEGVERPGDALDGVVVGEILSLDLHPRADSLSVCQIGLGKRRIQVVSGAPNLKVGARVALALPGSRPPGAGEEVRIIELRGVRSEGVVCSEKELGLGDDESGALILDSGTPAGIPLAEGLGLDDTVFDVWTPPNRPDLYSVLGVAREVAALSGNPLREPETALNEDAAESLDVNVKIESLERCSRYCARLIRGVKIGPSPAWMQQRLRIGGMRPINNVVDVTNYCMLELGQPLHAFDHSKLREGKVVVRLARAGETIRTIDGEERDLDEGMLVIADGVGPVAVAGVMGGADSEVSPETEDVLLESATFDGAGVRTTARKLGMQTEASLRFEKGLDVRLSRWAIDRAAALLAELSGGKVVKGVADVHGELPETHAVKVRPDRVNQLLGTQISPAEMKRILVSLSFDVTLKGDKDLLVKVPSHRSDVRLEADVAEEVARLYGYDRIESALPRATSEGWQTPPLPVLDRMREILVGAGLYESITYSFTSERRINQIGLPAGHPWRNAVRLLNPLSEEQALLRTHLAGHLLEAVSRNQRRGVQAVHLFEIASVFSQSGGEQPTERLRMGIVMWGRKPGWSWGEPVRDVDFYDLKGVVESLGEALRNPLTIESGNHPILHPGRSARLLLDGEEAGLMGEVHPDALEAFDITGRVYIAEIDLAAWVQRVGSESFFEPLPKHPAVRRDLALIVPDDVEAERVRNHLLKKAGDVLERCELFDVYAGKQIDPGFRSLAYTLTFRRPERTLTEDEVNELVDRMTAGLDRFGVRVRG